MKVDPSQRQKEEKTETIWLLTLSELRDLWKDYGCCTGDGGASILDLAGSEAKQLRSLSRETGTDKAIGKETQSFTEWQPLLSVVRERCLFKEDLVFSSGK